MKHKEEIIIDIRKASYLGILLLFVSFVFSSIFFLIFWSYDLYISGIIEFLFNILITIPVFLLGVFSHELLHFFVILFFEKIKIKYLKFGFKKSIGAPYVQCLVPINAINYKISLITPLILLGIIPLITSIILGNTWLLLFGSIFTSAASGDIMVFLKIYKIQNHTKILDHDNEPGFYLME